MFPLYTFRRDRSIIGFCAPQSTRHRRTSFSIIFLQEIGQFTDTIVDAFEFGVGVPHGHAKVGVTHGLQTGHLTQTSTTTPGLAACRSQCRKCLLVLGGKLVHFVLIDKTIVQRIS